MKAKIIIAIIVILICTGLFVYLKKSPQVVPNNNTVATSTDSNLKYTIVKSMESSTFGKYLTDSKGMTLYVNSDDERFNSNCNAECVEKWPIYEYNNINLIYVTDELSKRIGSTIRDKDGNQYSGWNQYSYNGKPLYYYIGDKNPGDINGIITEDLGSKWSIVKLD